MGLKGYIEGFVGERLAREYLEDNGYTIITTNFKNKLGEIDIIAKKKSYLVFVEVKARENALYGRPCEFVSRDKQRKVRNAAIAYLKMNGLTDCDVCFDVIEVLGDKVNLIENAFWKPNTVHFNKNKKLG